MFSNKIFDMPTIQQTKLQILLIVLNNDLVIVVSININNKAYKLQTAILSRYAFLLLKFPVNRSEVKSCMDFPSCHHDCAI